MPPSNSSDDDRSHHSVHSQNSSSSSSENDSLSPNSKSIRYSSATTRSTSTSTTAKPHLYEQLGAPTVLYRHKPSYGNSSTSLSATPKIPVDPHYLTTHPNSNNTRNETTSNNHHVDHLNLDTTYPPQPWNRRRYHYRHGDERNNTGTTKSSSSIEKYSSTQKTITDANHCLDILQRSNRSRIRTYFSSSLNLPNNNPKHNNNNNVTDTNQYYLQFPIFNNEAPIDKIHYHDQMQKYDSTNNNNYILLPTYIRKKKEKETSMDHLLIASCYQKQRMECSPVDSYCAPFMMNAVRYGMMGIDENDDDDDDDESKKHNTNDDHNDNDGRNSSRENLIQSKMKREQIDRMDVDEWKKRGSNIIQDTGSDDDDETSIAVNEESDDNDNANHSQIVNDVDDDNDDDISDEIVDEDDKDSDQNENDSDYTNDSKSSDSDRINSDAENSDGDVTIKASSYTLKKRKVPSQQKKKKSRRIKLTHGQKTHVNECIQYHGNSLCLIPCICKACLESMKKMNNDNDENAVGDESTIGPNYFLLHPTGESVSLSFLRFPYGRKRLVDLSNNDYSNRDSVSQNIAHAQVVDVGGKVLQIDSCLNISHVVKHNISIFDDTNFAWTFVIRTAFHCSVVVVKLKDEYLDKARRGKKSNSKGSNRDDKHMDICTGEYQIIETHRIHLSPKDDNIYYEFLYQATQKQSSSWHGATYTNFAIVSSEVSRASEHYHHYKRETKIIHNVQVDTGGGSSNVQRHCIESLKDISHIEYSCNHPMVLWAAARSNANPSLYKGRGSFRRPIVGYGKSLYSIDLRCDRATFTWSPSLEEFMMDGIHSISGILSDYHDPYMIYIKSLTAGGKLYEIDSRMPSRAVFTWSLPGLCDDFKTRLTPSSVYGPGVLMTQPIDIMSISNEVQSPILCINQLPAAFGIQLYQRPFNYPRFSTRNLEIPMVTGLGATLNGNNESNSSCFTSSSSYPIYESTNIKGLVAFYVRSNQVHQNLESIGYESHPDKSLCIITENSLGDLQAQTLLALPHTEVKKAKIVTGNRVGSCAVGVPHINSFQTDNDRNALSTRGEIVWKLSNDFLCDSQATLKQHVASRTQCRQFESVQLGHIPHQETKETTRNTKDGVSFAHPLPSTMLGEEKRSCPLKLNAKYVKDPVQNHPGTSFTSYDSTNFMPNRKTDLDKSTINKLQTAWVVEEDERALFENE